LRWLSLQLPHQANWFTQLFESDYDRMMRETRIELERINNGGLTNAEAKARQEAREAKAAPLRAYYNTPEGQAARRLEN
jgi:hypothetical protein